jgi:hypothetical protein
MLTRALCIIVGIVFLVASARMTGFSWGPGYKGKDTRAPTVWNRLLIFAIGAAVILFGLLLDKPSM